MVKVDQICHKNSVKFFTGDVFGYHGYMFADLGEHEFVEWVGGRAGGQGSVGVSAACTRSGKLPALETLATFDLEGSEKAACRWAPRTGIAVSQSELSFCFRREKTKVAKVSPGVEDGPDTKKAKLDSSETTMVKKVSGRKTSEAQSVCGFGRGGAGGGLSGQLQPQRGGFCRLPRWVSGIPPAGAVAPRRWCLLLGTRDARRALFRPAHPREGDFGGDTTPLPKLWLLPPPRFSFFPLAVLA